MMNRFGLFINKKRIEMNISLRSFSKKIGISAEYLSKIENGLRAAPKEKIIELIADSLSLTTEEKELFFDLAAESKNNPTLASDLVEYVYINPAVKSTLRLAKRNNLSDEQWQKIYDEIMEKYL